MDVNPVALYCLLCLAGGVGYWQTGGLRGCLSDLDPVDALWALPLMLTPIPGLVAISHILHLRADP